MSSLSNVSFFWEMFCTAMDGVEWFFAAYLVCILCFFVIGRKELSLAFLYPFLFMLITIFNPFLIMSVADEIGLTTRIRRLFWLIPVNLVLAYAFTSLCTVRAKKWLRTLIAAGCIAFTVCCGTSAVPHLQMPKNIYKTSNEVLTISSIIAEDSAACGIEKKAAYSNLSLLELRQFDPSIRNVIRRSDLLSWSIDPTDDARVQKVLDSGHRLHTLTLVLRYGLSIRQDAFEEALRKLKVNYLITENDRNLAEYFASAGYDKIGDAGIFEVYRIRDLTQAA